MCMHNGIALLYTWNEHNIVNQLTVFLNIYNIIVNTENLLCLVTQSYPTLCDPMDCSPAGSSVHGIFQARVLEWVAIAFTRGSSPPRDWTRISSVSRIAGRFFSHWAVLQRKIKIFKKKENLENSAVDGCHSLIDRMLSSWLLTSQFPPCPGISGLSSASCFL